MTNKITQHELWKGSAFVVQNDPDHEDGEFPFSIHSRTDTYDNSICNNKLIQLSSAEAEGLVNVLTGMLVEHMGEVGLNGVTHVKGEFNPTAERLKEIAEQGANALLDTNDTSHLKFSEFKRKDDDN